MDAPTVLRIINISCTCTVTSNILRSLHKSHNLHVHQFTSKRFQPLSQKFHKKHDYLHGTMTITSRALSAEHHTTLNMTSGVNRTSYTTCITFGCLCFSRGRNVVCCRNPWMQHVGLRVGALTRGQIDGSRSTQNDNNPISATPDFHTSFYWFVETHRTMCNTRFTNATRRVNWVTI